MQEFGKLGASRTISNMNNCNFLLTNPLKHDVWQLTAKTFTKTFRPNNAGRDWGKCSIATNSTTRLTFFFCFFFIGLNYV